MKYNMKQQEKLEEVLFRAGKHTNVVMPGAKWQTNLMRQIRLAGPLSSRKNESVVYGRIVWKVALSAAACAAFMFVFVEQKGDADNYVSKRVELDNSFEHILADAF